MADWSTPEVELGRSSTVLIVSNERSVPLALTQPTKALLDDAAPGAPEGRGPAADGAPLGATSDGAEPDGALGAEAGADGAPLGAEGAAGAD